MRGYARILNGIVTVYLPGGGNRIRTTLKSDVSRDQYDAVSIQGGPHADGVYHANVLFWGRARPRFTCQIGKRVPDVSAEIARLEKAAARNRHRNARTHSPGIVGFQEREHASTQSIRAVAARQIDAASWLRMNGNG